MQIQCSFERKALEQQNAVTCKGRPPGLNVSSSGLRRIIPQGCRSKVGMKAGGIPGFGLKHLQSRRPLA